MADIWYSARSILLGIDQYTQSYLRAYNVAKKSMHPDAIWLCKLFEETSFLERGLSLIELSNTTNDPRLSCFAQVEKRYYTQLKDNPYIFARAMYKIHVDPLSVVPDDNDDPMILWSKRREYLRFQRKGDRKTYRPKIRECVCRAAELGINEAILEYLRKVHGLNRLKWLAKVVRETNGKYLAEFIHQIDQVLLPNAMEAAIFWTGIGKMFDSFEKRDIFMNPSLTIQHALEVYRRNCRCTKAAIDMWIRCSHRLNQSARKIIFNRDIRKKIALLIWKSKKEGFYE